MNGSELAGSSTASSPKSKEDPKAGNGHEETESNPFAEYMWMENEEDFNRQSKSNLNPDAKEFVPGVKY